jgi:capsid portal protein
MSNLRLRTVDLTNLDDGEPDVSDMEYYTEAVPMPNIQEQHWKVGDGMNGDPRFIIGQIAVVLVDKKQNIFEIRYYDRDGQEQGSYRMKLCEDKK